MEDLIGFTSDEAFSASLRPIMAKICKVISRRIRTSVLASSVTPIVRLEVNMAKKDKASDLPPELAEACATLGVDPGGLLDWRLYQDRVVVVAADGRKLVVQR